MRGNRKRMVRFGALAAAGLGAAALVASTTGAFAEEPEPKGDVETKIAGGKRAEEGQYPWMVSLSWTEDGSHFCGGSLIAPDLVLTAGHCFDEGSAETIEVRHGSVRHAETDAYQIEDYIVAPDYDYDLVHDWAVVKLTEPILGAQPIPLAPADLDNWTDFEVAGWGVRGHTGTSSNLRWAEVPYITDAECTELAGKWGFTPETQMCAGVLEEGAEVNACPADSGGPLMAEIAGQKVLAGIVSWGSDCYADPDPGVYTSVGAQIDDIALAIAQLSVKE